MRRLIDAAVRTETDSGTVVQAQALIDEATRLLSRRLVPGSFGIRRTAAGRIMTWGNVAVGLRNPVAPPLVIEREPDGSVWCEAELGAAYEGPPGCVHGGISALILDQLLGSAAYRPGQPAWTATLTVRYLRPMSLGRLRAEARVDRHEGVKTFASAHLADAEGMTVAAEGVLIRPREPT